MYSIYKDFYLHHRNLVHERNTARHPQKNSKSGHEIKRKVTDLTHIFTQDKKYDLGRAEDISCNYTVVKQKIKVSYYLKKERKKKKAQIKFDKIGHTHTYSDKLLY